MKTTTTAILLLISTGNAAADHQPTENDLLRSRMSGDLIAGNTQASPKNDKNHEVTVNNVTAAKEATPKKYVSFCQDPDTIREWEEMMKKYGHSPNWQHLHAEWKRLCTAVDDDKMTLESAIEEFEQERVKAAKRERQRLQLQEAVMIPAG